MRRRFERAVTELADLCEQAGDYPTAILHAERLLGLAPLDESNVVRLMRLHARRGDRASMQRVYQQCVITLEAELAIEPAPATRQAYALFLREAAPREATPTAPATAERPGRRLPSLPRPTSTLVGREQELQQIAHHLAETDCSLLSIIGPGGMGKTRLALAVAHEQQARFAHGALFVSAAALSDVAQLPQTLADALNLTFTGRSSIQQQILHYLADKEMLLVLDNLEHLPEVGVLLGEVLSVAEGLKMIVTSRGRLHLPQELVLDLGGLPIPTDDGDWADDSAATLFLQRARRVKMNFTPTPADRQAILTICRLVDGSPLALELAANWVRLLSVNEIAEEIARDLDFLAAPSQQVPARHRSLRAVFDHSWRLLAPVEQRLLQRLSLFHGGFTRDAAGEVADLPSDAPILPLLVGLIDKSLVRRTSDGRYDLHELIRHYAAAHLHTAPDDSAVAGNRYAHHYLTWMQECLPLLQSGRQKETLQKINVDVNNVRASWEWAVAHAELPLLKESAWVVWYYFDLRNLYAEFVSMFLRAEDVVLRLRAHENQPDALVAQCDNTLSHLRIWRAFSGLRLGQVNEMRRLAHESLDTLRRQDDLAGLGDGLWVHGILSWLSGDFTVAAQSLLESLELNLALNRPWQTGFTLTLLGAVRHEQGDYAEAHDLLSRGLVSSRELGVPRNSVFALGLLARTATALGRPEEVTDLMRENLRLAIEMDDNSAIAYALENLGLTLQASGHLVDAGEHFQQAIAYHSEIADLWSASRTLSYAGQLALQKGDRREARADFTRALQTAMKAQFHPYALDALMGLAELNRCEGKCTSALVLAAYVLQHPAAAQAVKDRAFRLQTGLELEVSPGQLEQAREQAQSLTFEAVVDGVLVEAAPL